MTTEQRKVKASAGVRAPALGSEFGRYLKSIPHQNGRQRNASSVRCQSGGGNVARLSTIERTGPLGGTGGTISTESLILAQDERWRRA